MTRHSRNSTSGTVYTYHEKQQDAKASEYGTREVRVGKDSVKKFDCCCLTNQPCRDPVVTPQGHLYEREVILQYMLQQRQELLREAKARQRQLASEAAKRERERLDREHQADVKKYLSANCVASAAGDKKPVGEGERQTNFWVPSATASSSTTSSSAASSARPSDDTIRCPMSKKPLRLKDLIAVKFKPAPDEGYVCALTGDAIGDSTPLCVLRPSGCIVTKEAADRLVRPEMRDPISGRELTEADIVPLQRGASGFAGSGHNLVSKGTGVVMQVT